VTNLVIDWVEHGAPNHGLLLKLADGEEDLPVSGPMLPSEFADAALRPLLEVTYLGEGGAKPGSDRVGHGVEVGPQAVVARHLDHRAER
jgi:hypothetical protein